jgi:starch synthase
MHVLFATAELSPLARVGGLAEAAAGLVWALRASGTDVTVVVPDYDGRALVGGSVTDIGVPEWASPARVRWGVAEGFGSVALVETPGTRRSHPYVDPWSGWGWGDNDRRFFGFSAVVAALADRLSPDVVHLNDWHTGAAASLLGRRFPIVFTIHNLAYQGQSDPGWMAVLGPEARALAWGGATNPMAGGIRLADRVVAVSPTYAREILDPIHGMGLHGLLAERGDALVGIRNGIDTAGWDPAHDPYLPEPFGMGLLDTADLAGREACRAQLRAELGLVDGDGPVLGLVSRFVDQKGIDLALGLVPFLDDLPAQLAVLGAGDPDLAAWARWAAGERPDRVAYFEGYHDGLGRRIFGGADLYLVPSRFEPCGLTQMQAMRYGAIPVVNDVGGLHDTVVDADRDRRAGTGFVSRRVDVVGLVDAVHRADRAWRDPKRRLEIQRRGMVHDWSWTKPAARYRAIYDAVAHHP